MGYESDALGHRENVGKVFTDFDGFHQAPGVIKLPAMRWQYIAVTEIRAPFTQRVGAHTAHETVSNDDNGVVWHVDLLLGKLWRRDLDFLTIQVEDNTRCVLLWRAIGAKEADGSWHAAY